jgi:hypothetical protein
VSDAESGGDSAMIINAAPEVRQPTDIRLPLPGSGSTDRVLAFSRRSAVELSSQLGCEHPEFPGLGACGLQLAGVSFAPEPKVIALPIEFLRQHSLELFEIGDPRRPLHPLCRDPLVLLLISDFDDDVTGTLDKSQNPCLYNTKHRRCALILCSRPDRRVEEFSSSGSCLNGLITATQSRRSAAGKQSA